MKIHAHVRLCKMLCLPHTYCVGSVCCPFESENHIILMYVN